MMPSSAALLGSSSPSAAESVIVYAVPSWIAATCRCEAARGAGFRDVVAPPMFTVVYSSPAMAPAILDPDVGINLAQMVHGGQEFVWGEPVCAGDTITTTASVKEIFEKDGKGFYVFESVSANQDGDEVVRATWTNIVRGV